MLAKNLSLLDKEELLELVQGLEEKISDLEMTHGLNDFAAFEQEKLASKKKLIEELVGFWGTLLIGHHKDSDCHFEIVIDYGHNGREDIVVQHGGYIDDHWSFVASSLGEAYEVLEKQLRRQILERISSAKIHYDYEGAEDQKFWNEKEKKYQEKFKDWEPDWQKS